MDAKTAVEYSQKSIRQLKAEARCGDAWAELILGRRYELAIGVRQDSAQALWHYRRAASMRTTKQWALHRQLSDANYHAIVCVFLRIRDTKCDYSCSDVLLSDDVVLQNLDAAEQWWNSRGSNTEIETGIWSNRLLAAAVMRKDIYEIIRKLSALARLSRYSRAVLYAYTKAMLKGYCGTQINEEIDRLLNSGQSRWDDWYEDKRQFYIDLSKALSLAYGEGWGTKQDASASLYFLRRAACLCDVDAQRKLAALYGKGTGVDANHDIAEYWICRSNHGGSPLHNELTGALLNTMLAEEIAKVESCGIALLGINPTITIDSKTRAWGVCSPNRKDGKASISLSSKFIEGDEAQVREVIAHEVIHAAVDARAHGKQWLVYVEKVLQRYGYPFPTARGDFSTAAVNPKG
jgi:TPR repeat protein